MAKDPAVLVYIDTWIASTNGMKACYRAWYFDLLLYQYDKGEVPNDLDELAGICRVRPSEYDLFKQMVQQVLKQKFKQTESGCYVNEVASEIVSKRQQYKQKRAKSGTIGAIVKKAGGIKGFKKSFIDRLKNELFEKDLNELEDYKDEDLLKHLLKLYKDGDGDVDGDIDTIKDKKGGVGEKTEIDLPYSSERFRSVWEEWKEYKAKEHRFRYKTSKSELAALAKLSGMAINEHEAISIIQESIANGWKGFFPIKNNNGKVTELSKWNEMDVELDKELAVERLKKLVDKFVDRNDMIFSWDDHEVDALESIGIRLKGLMKQRGDPLTMDQLEVIFGQMLDRLDDWNKRNFSMKSINSNFNKVINAAKTNKDAEWDAWVASFN